MPVCSQCLRMMRQTTRAEKINKTFALSPDTRLLSTTSRRWQQPQQISQESDLAPTPSATSTTNTPSNSSSPPPPSAKKLPAGKLPDPSTREMQRRINHSLRTQGSISHRLAESLRKTAKSATESYITYGLTEALFKSCAAQAPYTVPEDLRMGVYTGKGPPKNTREEDVGVPEDPKSWWFRDLELEPTFSIWSQVTFLHMYICTVKLRTLETHKQYLDYQRYLLEHFSNAAEEKMILLHGMNARGVRNRFLKDLFLQWRGVLYAYDQGLVQGDAVLASAIWRNLWKAEEDVDWTKVAQVVGFVRRSIAGMADVDIQEVASGLQTSSQFWQQAQHGLDKMVDAKSLELR